MRTAPSFRVGGASARVSRERPMGPGLKDISEGASVKIEVVLVMLEASCRRDVYPGCWFFLLGGECHGKLRAFWMGIVCVCVDVSCHGNGENDAFGTKMRAKRCRNLGWLQDKMGLFRSMKMILECFQK